MPLPLIFIKQEGLVVSSERGLKYVSSLFLGSCRRICLIQAHKTDVHDCYLQRTRPLYYPQICGYIEGVEEDRRIIFSEHVVWSCFSNGNVGYSDVFVELHHCKGD